MQKINKINKIFGPVGSISGYVVAFVGVIVLFDTLKGLFFIIIGLFIGFTSNVTYIDFDQKRFRSAINFFGIFPIGKWINIEPDMGLNLKRSNIAWRTYSMTNQTYDLSDGDYRIELTDRYKKILAVIERCKSPEDAKVALSFYAEKLQLSVK